MQSNRRTFLAATSAAGLAPAQVTGKPFHTFEAALPPLTPGHVKHIHMASQEVPVCIKPGLVVAGWTFDGDIPGPIIHVRQGDTVEFTLTNRGMMPHSMASIMKRRCAPNAANGCASTWWRRDRHIPPISTWSASSSKPSIWEHRPRTPSTASRRSVCPRAAAWFSNL